MGAYYELVLACDLKQDIPQQVIDILSYICDALASGERSESLVKPDHWFFKQANWSEITGVDTMYLPGDIFAQLTWAEFNQFYRFTIRTTVKHAGEWLIAAFVHWLAPYSETQGFVGYTRGDESPDVTDLIYFENGDVYYNTVVLYKNPPEVKRHKITP
jgi:hypothetical protein